MLKKIAIGSLAVAGAAYIGMSVKGMLGKANRVLEMRNTVYELGSTGGPISPFEGMDPAERARILRNEALLYWGKPGQYIAANSAHQPKITDFTSKLQKSRDGSWSPQPASTEEKSFELSKQLALATYLRAFMRCPEIYWIDQPNNPLTTFVDPSGKKIWPVFTSQVLAEKFSKNSTGAADAVVKGSATTVFNKMLRQTDGVFLQADFLMVDPSSDFKTHSGVLSKQEYDIAQNQRVALALQDIISAGRFSEPALDHILISAFVDPTNTSSFDVSGAALDKMLIQIFSSHVHRNIKEFDKMSRGEPYQLVGGSFGELLRTFSFSPQTAVGVTLDRLPHDWEHLAGQDYPKERKDLIKN